MLHERATLISDRIQVRSSAIIKHIFQLLRLQAIAQSAMPRLLQLPSIIRIAPLKWPEPDQ
jgi:hypothetical protein